MGRHAPLVLAFALLSLPSTAQSGQAKRGLAFVQANCAGCHAVGQVGESPLPIAPPFRTLPTRYLMEDLAETLAEGVTTGHPSMPEFRLDPIQVSDMVAYLRTLER